MLTSEKMQCSEMLQLNWCSSFLLCCKVYSYRNGIYAIIFYEGCMAFDPQWQKEMITEYLQCTCWILTAGSDVLHFWPCEMLSCLCNASHIKCTNCREGSSCLHKDIFLKTNVVQVSFTNAIFLLLFHDMGSAWCIFLYFKCGTGKS